MLVLLCVIVFLLYDYISFITEESRYVKNNIRRF